MHAHVDNGAGYDCFKIIAVSFLLFCLAVFGITGDGFASAPNIAEHVPASKPVSDPCAEIVFIDPGVTGYGAFLEAPGEGVETVVLSGE